MYVSKRTAVSMLTVAALAGSAASAVTALAHQRGRDRGRGHSEDRSDLTLLTSLAPSVPTDPPLLGTAAGGVPWVLDSGEAKLRDDGRLTVRIRGLLIPSGPFAGTTGPVKTVTASLYCGDSSTPVGTSDAVPFASDGDARISTTVALPAKCQIPALLIHPNGSPGTYIASSGLDG